QVASIPPNVVWKLAVVPSGTGLLNRSVTLTVTGTVTPSTVQASTFGHFTANEMLWLVAMPVDIVKALDSVEIVAPTEVVVMAVTRTVVATVPPLTIVCTCPVASVTHGGDMVMPHAGDMVMPPTLVLSFKVTGAPTRGPPEVSKTLKITIEVAEPPALPTPFSVIFEGVAEMKAIDPIAAGATVTVPVAVSVWLFAVAVAVITSLPLQPVAT